MSKRLYAQLQPSPTSLSHLIDLQSKIPQRGRWVSPKRIHLTLIHFGIIDEIINAMPCDRAQAERAVARYITSTSAVLAEFPEQLFRLQPIDFALFGQFGRTLVVRYEPTAHLHELHAQLLILLQRFFVECGIADVDTYMQNDPNFQNALIISPHITITKGYDGKIPLANDLRPIDMTIMPFEYEQP